MMHDKIEAATAPFTALDAQNIAFNIDANAHKIGVLAVHAATQLNDLMTNLKGKVESCWLQTSEWELLSVLLDVIARNAEEIQEESERIELWGHLKWESGSKRG